MEHYFDPKVECASREQITAWQNERLVRQVERIEDLHLLPTLSKDDLRDQYPYGLMAAPLSDCVRIHSTSGTTGRRVVAFYTQHDVDLWEECCARALAAAGTFYRRSGPSRRFPQAGKPDAPHVFGQYGPPASVHD